MLTNISGGLNRLVTSESRTATTSRPAFLQFKSLKIREIGAFYVVQKRRGTDFGAPKL